MGLGFNVIEVKSTRHAFSLSDPSISYPYKADTVSVPVLIAVVVLCPAGITALLSLLIPLPSSPSTPRSLIFRRKLWEWNTAWMGLGVSLASAFMITGKSLTKPELVQQEFWEITGSLEKTMDSSETMSPCIPFAVPSEFFVVSVCLFQPSPSCQTGSRLLRPVENRRTEGPGGETSTTPTCSV